MVSLSSALYTSTNSIKVNSEAIGITAGNIANANNDKYLKKMVKLESLVANGQSVGVKISAVENQFNEYLKVNLDAQASVSAASGVTFEFLDRMNLLMGDPSKANHLSATLNNFFQSFSGLIASPDSSTSRQNVVNSAQAFTLKLKEVAQGVQSLRYEVDHEIKRNADKVNLLLKNIKDMNAQLNSFDLGSLGQADTEQQILEKISELSQYIEVKGYKNSNGNYMISAGNGISLLDENLYSLEYNPASSVQSIIAGSDFQPLQILFAGEDNSKITTATLISSGKSSEITSKLVNGRISGLQKLRDEIFPDFIERLDTMADNIIFEFNKHHNEGAGTLLKSEYLSDRAISKEELRSWNGKVRIGVVDPEGRPIGLASEEDPNFKLPALDIDLAALKGKYGSAAGQDLSIQDIVGEINQHFMDIFTQNRVKIGYQDNYDSAAGIADIKLVSDQILIDDDANLTFDFEISNNDASDFSMEILDLNVDGAGAVVTTASDIFSSKAGEKQRTNTTNVVNLTGSLTGVYEITAKIKVINQETKVVSISNVTYQVKVGQVNAFNKRFSATSASGDGVAVNNTYGATIVTPKSNNTFLTADIVNKNGLPVGNNEAGFLSIKSVNGSKYRIVIDDNPTINGENTNPSIDMGIRNIDNSATHKGFSHYYGLNNLFIEKSKDLGIASSIEVTSSVAKNPALLSTAKLKPATELKEFIVRADKKASTGSLKLDTLPTGGTITVNGFTFNLTATPALPTDIDISSGTTDDIVNAIVAKLSSSITEIKNNGVDLATYSVDPDDSSKILVNYNTPGLGGDNFTFAVNLSGGGAATINDGVSASNSSGTLSGGTADRPTKVLKRQFYQSVLKGNNQVAQDIMFSLKQSIDFNGTSFSTKQTILEFSNINITSHISNKTHQAAENNKLADLQYNNLNKNFREGAEVDIDEELSSMILYNIVMQASSKMISTISQMFDYLINAI